MHRSIPFLVALAAGSAIAPAYGWITASWVPLTITQAAIADDPQLAAMQSWSLTVTTSGNWSAAGLEAFLPPGWTFYNHPLGGNTRPNPAVVALHPAVAFDTYVTAPGDTPVILGDFPETSFLPDFGGTTGRFSVSWGDWVNDPPGTYEIARLTFPMGTPMDGNPQSATFQINPDATAYVFPLTPFVTNRWLPDADGSWHAPNHWLWGRLPGSRDFVVIDVGGDQIRTIEYSQGSTQVLQITSNEHLLLTGGTLTVSPGHLTTASLTISGGALRSTTVNGAPAVFGPAGGRLHNITLNQGMVVAHPTQVVVESGLRLNGVSTISSGATLRFEGSQTVGGGGTIGFDGRGQIDITPGSTLTLASTLRVRKTGSDVLRINGGFAQTGASTIDLAEGSLLNDYTGDSPFGSIRASIITGYKNGDWDGVGINSSTAAAETSFALGYAEASALFTNFPATYEGEEIDDTTVIVRLTRVGDVDLDGVVDLSDFNHFAANFGSTGAVWSDGDLNYDGIVNLADFNHLAANFGLAAGPDGPAPEDWAALAAAVPEPGVGILMWTWLLRRRRRAVRDLF